MSENFDGVWELRIFYTTTPTSELLMNHRMTMDVNVINDPPPGSTFDEALVEFKGGGSVALTTWLMDMFMPLLVAAFNTATDFVTAELWKIPEGTYDATFIAVHEIGESGTNATTATVAQQTTFTFRSQGGGTARLQLMESSFSGSLKQSPPYASAVANNLTTFLIGSDSVMLARDNTPLIARIRQSDGQNEKLWRKRFRAE